MKHRRILAWLLAAVMAFGVMSAGVLAAETTIPVIGIPISSGGLGGLDALLATVQMPTGIPVATVAVNGAGNAAHLAAQILALSDDELAKKLADGKENMRQEVLKKDLKMQENISEL